VERVATDMSLRRVCQALGLSRSTWYRSRGLEPRRASESRPSRKPPRRLTQEEAQQALDLLHSERFVDRSPAEVYATLLDEGVYVCSERTLYRLLAQHDEVRERRAQRRHPHYRRPELLATAPNQVWSWDITKLRGPVKGLHYSLYVLLDIFSRFVTGWMLAEVEAARLAEQLLSQAVTRLDIPPGQLTVHADRGAAQRAKSVALLFADLGITRSFSRPHTSNDNPYSEAHFKTLKYHPSFPERFGSLPDARAFCRTFFNWYNHQHRHAGLALLTPADVHFGRTPQILEHRAQVLDAAYRLHPERFPQRPPTPRQPPSAVWINPPQDPDQGSTANDSLNPSDEWSHSY
jgi:putative transposase